MRTRNVTRTIKTLKKNGYEFVGVVERYNHHAKKRIDLFGFGDILALSKGKPPLLIQVKTENSRLSSYKHLKLFSCKGIKFEIWIWKKKKGKYCLKILNLKGVKNGHRGKRKTISSGET